MTECAICLQLLRTPVRVLNCGHSFCERCLRQMRRQTAGPSNRRLGIRLTCPTCRRETLLVDGRVSSLPTNYALNELLDAIRITNGNVNAEAEEPNEDDAASSLIYPVNENNEIITESALDSSSSPHSVARILNYRARLRGHTVPMLLNAQTQTSADLRPAMPYSPLSLSLFTATTTTPGPSVSSRSGIISSRQNPPSSVSSPSSLFSNISPSTTSSIISISSLSTHGDISTEDEDERSYWTCLRKGCGFHNYVNQHICQKCFAFRGRRYSAETSSRNEITETSAGDSFDSTHSTDISFASFSETCTDMSSISDISLSY